ncbi:MAG: 3-deoxy-manno-octulosonate cytidylyltransferase [Oleispira sp.]|nr:3-deoxy-manno-octulosonate cytidylyltransferase [Oleispira sp.]
MKNVVIIPARFASTRFPGKPLVRFKGGDGIERSLIEHTWNAAQSIKSADAVFVATDNIQIADAVAGFGGEVLMTSTECRNGTERCAEAIKQLPPSIEFVINLQGDAPLTPGYFIDSLLASISLDPNIAAATPVLKCDVHAKQRLINDRKNGRVGGTTAVFNNKNHALYFSKEVTPFGEGDVFHHVGVYVYRPNALAKYTGWPEGYLEKSEGLEQLRFLENGENMLCVEVDANGKEFWEVNNPEDIPLIEKLLGVTND